jgi:HSP20 family protein
MANEIQKHAQAGTTGVSTAARGSAGSGTSLSRGLLAASPFSLMRTFMDDLDRLFDGFRHPGPSGMSVLRSDNDVMWVPPLEVIERDGQLAIRAEVPGLSKDDVNIEIQDGQLVISGERKQEHEEQQGDVYRSERAYGSFCRAVLLPEGVKPEEATATFADGVLEITIPAPREAKPSAKRVEIRERSRNGNNNQQPQTEPEPGPPRAAASAAQ